MIEPTGEMRLAFDEAPAADKGCTCAICLNHRLAAVLALVGRDRCLEAKGHVWHPLAKLPALGVCSCPSGRCYGRTSRERRCREALVREVAEERTMTDDNHFDTACDDRPYCRIREHHDL